MRHGGGGEVKYLYIMCRPNAHHGCSKHSCPSVVVSVLSLSLSLCLSVCLSFPYIALNSLDTWIAYSNPLRPTAVCRATV
jgi:hypothetical protein